MLAEDGRKNTAKQNWLHRLPPAKFIMKPV